MQHYSFFDPDTKFLGQVSSQDKRSLRKGELYKADNIRASKRVPAVRGPITLKTVTGLVTGTYKGSYECFLSGVRNSFVAIRASSVTKVYRTTDAGDSPTYTEITGTAGKYPDTQFSGDGNVCFASCREPYEVFLSSYTSRDYVVFSNGLETMLYKPADSSCCKVNRVEHPGPSSVRQRVTMGNYLDMSASNVTESTDASAHITVNDNQAHPTTGGLTPYASFGTSTVATNWAKYAFTTGAAITVNGGNLLIVYDTVNFSDPWSCLKIEVSADDATYYTVYTPGTNDAPVLVDGDKTFTLAAFRVDPTVVGGSTWKYIKFTWTAGFSPATASELYLIAIGGGGSTPGSWSFGQTFGNSATFTESIGVVCDDKDGVNLSLQGLQDARNDIQLPVSPLVTYTYSIDYQMPTQAQLDNGVDLALFYAASSATADLTLVWADTISSYSGGWTGDNTVSSVVKIILDPVASPKVFTGTLPIRSARVMPDGLNMQIPPCTSMITASGRLFCGGAQSDLFGGLSATASDVLYSDQDFPTRMRGLTATNSDSSVIETAGGMLRFHGEKVQALTSVATNFQDIDSVFIFTDTSLHTAGGRTATSLSRPVRIGYHGTLSPWSVCSYKSSVYWVDQEKQVQKYENGQISPVSKYKVDDITTGIPDAYIGSVAGHCHRDNYYLALTPSGATTNTLVLVYDTFLDFWVQDTTQYATTFGRFFSWGDQLRCWAQDPDSTRKLFEHDAATGTTDPSSTGIVITVTTGEVGGELSQRSMYSNPWIVCEADSGNSLTFTLSGRPDTVTSPTSTISLTATGTETTVRRVVTDEIAIEADSGGISFTGTVSARKKLIAFGFDYEPLPGDTFERV